MEKSETPQPPSGQPGQSVAVNLEAVLAAQPDASRGEAIYEVCAACHQASGWGVHDGSVPHIAGQHYRYLVGELVDFHNNERRNLRMQHFMSASLFEQPQAIADVAAYIAELAPTQRPAQGGGSRLAQGEALYGDLCTYCHGRDGRGNASFGIPRIAGQHYTYLIRRLRLITAGEGHEVNQFLPMMLAPMRDEEISAVADYVSRLPAR